MYSIINVVTIHFASVVCKIHLVLNFQTPSIDDKVDLHFISFVNVGGQLCELGKLSAIKSHAYIIVCADVSVSHIDSFLSNS